MFPIHVNEQLFESRSTDFHTMKHTKLAKFGSKIVWFPYEYSNCTATAAAAVADAANTAAIVVVAAESVRILWFHLKIVKSRCMALQRFNVSFYVHDLDHQKEKQEENDDDDDDDDCDDDEKSNNMAQQNKAKQNVCIQFYRPLQSRQ